jgi:hypothetical protein
VNVGKRFTWKSSETLHIFVGQQHGRVGTVVRKERSRYFGTHTTSKFLVAFFCFFFFFYLLGGKGGAITRGDKNRSKCPRNATVGRRRGRQLDDEIISWSLRQEINNKTFLLASPHHHQPTQSFLLTRYTPPGLNSILKNK